MTDDIVNQLRGQFSNFFRIDHPNLVRVPTLYEKAADEIERLRELAKALYEETKKCGSKHDVKATNDWEEYIDEVRGD